MDRWTERERGAEKDRDEETEKTNRGNKQEEKEVEGPSRSPSSQWKAELSLCQFKWLAVIHAPLSVSQRPLGLLCSQWEEVEVSWGFNKRGSDLTTCFIPLCSKALPHTCHHPNPL